MCNGLSSFAEAICSGTRAIKSQTRASGVGARRRGGRVHARSVQRHGGGARRTPLRARQIPAEQLKKAGLAPSAPRRACGRGSHRRGCRGGCPRRYRTRAPLPARPSPLRQRWTREAAAGRAQAPHKLLPLPLSSLERAAQTAATWHCGIGESLKGGQQKGVESLRCGVAEYVFWRRVAGGLCQFSRKLRAQ